MLSATRNFAKSWVAKVLMGLLVVAMAGFGVSRYGFEAVKGDEVIRAGSRKIDSNAFRREYDNQKRRIEQQAGQPISLEAAEQNHLDSLVLNGVATREAFYELLSRMNLKPSDKLVLEQISKNPELFDPVTGKFDKNLLRQRLAQNGLTPPMLDAIIRDELANHHLEVAVQNGLAVPRAYGALAAVFGLETRDLAYFTVPAKSIPQPAPPTDAQLTALINENKSYFTLPEMRTLTVVLFAPESFAQAMANAPIDPAELQKRYNFRKDTLSKPETRTVVQVPVKDQATAQKVTARLNAGEAPDAVAKSIGAQVITYADKPLTAVSDRKIGQAAFKMQAGQVSTIQGDLGLAVVKVESVSEGREVTLEQARPMLEAEIRKDMLAEKVYAQVQAYDDAHQGGASLADAAAKAGARVQTLPAPVSAQGVTPERQQVNIPPKILETAFTIPQGGDSEVTDLGDGRSFAVRVEKVIPAHVQPLAEVRAQATQIWLQREVGRALEAKATALTARLNKGETIDAVAASAGVPVTRVSALARATAQSHPELSREVLGRAFGSKSGEAWFAGVQGGVAIGQVSNIHMDVGPTAAGIAESQRRELTVALYREMDEAAHNYARTKLKVRVDPVRARAAAGFEPLEKDKAGKKK